LLTARQAHRTANSAQPAPFRGNIANAAAADPSKNASGVNLTTCSRNYIERAAFILLIQPRVTSSAMKQQRDGAGPSTSDFRDSRYGGAVRATLGKKLYAEVDECAAAMVCAANRKPREPEGRGGRQR
jgi:hypothetical protein